MNLERLKQNIKQLQIINKFKMVDIYRFCSDIEKLFSEYEQANSKEEKKEDSETFSLRRELDEIWEVAEKNQDEYRASIEALKAEIETLKKMLSDLGEVKNQQMPTPEEKEPTYKYDCHGIKKGDKFEMEYLRTSFESVCNILNAQEAGK